MPPASPDHPPTAPPRERDPIPATTVIVRVEDPASLAATLAALGRQSSAPHHILVAVAREDARLRRGIEAAASGLPIQIVTCGSDNPAVQRNQAIRHADSALIAFLEAGTAPRPDWLQCLEAMFRTHGHIDAVQGDLVATGTGARERLEIEEFRRRVERGESTGAGFVDTRNFAIRGGTIRRYREPFNERIAGGEQEDLHCKLAADGIRPCYSAAATVALGPDATPLATLFRRHYRDGIGLLQLRRLHEGFQDVRLDPARSKAAALRWLLRELAGRRWFETARPAPWRHALAAYPALAARRLGLLAGLTAGRGKALPVPAAGMTPEDLLLFVTNKCNLRCQHCFYIDELNRSTRTLNAEAVARLVDSLSRDLRTVSLTGGEPFLCPDLTAICEVFARRIKTRDLSIASNGYYTERTLATVREILAFANYDLYVRISLDGLKSRHDALRGNPHSFDHAVATIKALKALAATQPRLHVQIQTSVGVDNGAELEALAEFVAHELGVFQLFEFARDVGMFAAGDFLLPGYGPPDKHDLLTVDAMDGVLARIRAIYARHLPMGHYNRYQVDFQLELLTIAVSQVRLGKPVIRCTSGDSMACIQPNLDVAICEMTRPIGNLDEFAGDLARLLRERFTPAVRACRDTCHCTNACNNSSSLKSSGPAPG